MATKKRTKKAAAKKSPAKKSPAKKSPKRRSALKGSSSDDLHRLVGRAVTDPKFLAELLHHPERALDDYNLDRPTRREILDVVGSPAKLEKALLTFRLRIGRPSVEIV